MPGKGTIIKIITTTIPDVKIIEPEVFKDQRGFFFESFNQQKFNNLLGFDKQFVQDNHSRSTYGVLRGLHYQSAPFEQGKLVRVIVGEVFDVAVDIRKHSDTFGQWVGEFLSESNKKQLWIPEGFAHGFVVTSSVAEFCYKTTNFYSAKHENIISYKDPTLNIDWKIDESLLIVNERDLNGRAINEI